MTHSVSPGSETAFNTSKSVYEGADLDSLTPQEIISASIAEIQYLAPERAGAYQKVFNRLLSNSGETAWMFPDGVEETGREATENLIASGAVAAVRHVAGNESTSMTLGMIRGEPLTLKTSGTEPLTWLNTMSEVYWVAGEVMRNPDIQPELTVQGDGFRMYRFIDRRGIIPPCVNIYIRPRGSMTYDPRYEYGNASYGTEASVSLRVDVAMLQAYTDTGDADEGDLQIPDTRSEISVFSMRNDREAGARTDSTRSATQQDGAFVHDIGAIASPGISAQVGAFMTAGDIMRHGEASTWNHLRVFPAELGDADVFAAYAEALEQKILSKHLRSTGKVARGAGEAGLVRIRPHSDRPFPLFEIGDTPFTTDVRALAHATGLELPAEPRQSDIDDMFKVFGSESSFRGNIARFKESSSGLDLPALVARLRASGIDQAMPNRNVYGDYNQREFEHGVVLEGTAGWMKRRAAHLLETMQAGTRVGSVVLAATDRPLDTPTELVNPEVTDLQKVLKRDPTASEYMEQVIAPYLTAGGLVVKGVVSLPFKQVVADGSSRTTSAPHLMQAAMHTHPELKNGRILKAENAPAGAMFAEPLFTVHDSGGFDAASQLYFGSGPVRIGETLAEADHPRLFQNPYSAPSSLVRWVKALYDINRRFQ